MARRRADATAKHDSIVTQLASSLDDDWPDVFAVDVPTKHGSPSEIDSHHPDVMARSGDNTLIIEVETDQEDDGQQREGFEGWASAADSRSYVGVLATDYNSWKTFESVGNPSISD